MRRRDRRSDSEVVREHVAALGYAAGWALVRRLPHRSAHTLFRRGAEFAARRGGAGVDRLRANLTRLTGADAGALVVDAMRSYGRYWCEVFRLPALDPAAVHGGTDVRGGEHLDTALDDGRGVVLALTHSGNWDAAGIWLVEHLRRRGSSPTSTTPAFTTVAQRLRPEWLFRRFTRFRSALGFEVIGTGDGPAAHRALTGRLRAGGVVCLLADRDLGGSGVPVSFLGAPARLPSGPARVAALTGAALVPTSPFFTADGWGLAFAPPVPVAARTGVPAATQDLADVFGRLLAEHPADWHMLQPVWDADRVREEDLGAVAGARGSGVGR